MAERFDMTADPRVICKEMFSVKLDSDETLKEFAQRVQFMAMDAHPGAKEETIQQISIEVFLRGLPHKEAAHSSSDKCPKTIQKAMKYVKNAINTQKALFNKPSIPHHQVSFAELDEPDLSVRSTSESEATKLSSFQKRSLDTIMMEQELAHLRAKISQLESQHNSNDKPSRPYLHPVTPPPLTQTSTTPQFPSQSPYHNPNSPYHSSNSPYQLQDSPYRIKIHHIGLKMHHPAQHILRLHQVMGIQLLKHSTHLAINLSGWVRNASGVGELDTLHQNV